MTDRSHLPGRPGTDALTRLEFLPPGPLHAELKLAPIVERTCRAHGAPYRSQPTLRAALAANLGWLRQLGAGDPATTELAGP